MGDLFPTTTTMNTATTTTTMMDPEQRFLQARQARMLVSTTTTTTTASATTTTTTATIQERKKEEILGLFWSELRRRLQAWMDRLEKASTADTTTASSTINGSLRQELQEWKEELQALRQHCLHGGSITSTSSTSTTTRSSTSTDLSSFSVPTEFPNADLRLLHAEFTRCATRWEEIYQHLFPRERFTFQKYRQELARRTILGIPLQQQVISSTSSSSSSNKTNNNAMEQRNTERDDRAGTVQNISNSTIHIRHDGTVQSTSRQRLDDDIDDDLVVNSSSSSPQQITSAAILIRNVHNCTIHIDKVLESLHMVDMAHSTIDVPGGGRPIASAIHVTNCHDCRLQVPLGAQQLRIHESTRLRFRVPLVAGAILEDSNDIVFVFPNNSNNTDADIKDFNWLRTGIPSPNYRIEAATTTADEEMVRPQVKDEATNKGSCGPSVDEDLPPDNTTFADAVESSSPEEPDSDDEL